MALATYSNLKDAVIKWARRKDINDILDDAIDLAETDMYTNGPNGEPGIEIRDMEARATASMDNATPSRYLALPTSFVKMRRMELIVEGSVPDQVRKELKYRTPETLVYRAGKDIPTYFTITNQLEFDINPASNYTVEMQYYKSLTALSSSNTSNSILTRFPQVYLQGTLWAIFDSLRNEELAEYRYSKFRQAITSANSQDKKGRYGINRRMVPMGSTP